MNSDHLIIAHKDGFFPAQDTAAEEIILTNCQHDDI